MKSEAVVIRFAEIGQISDAAIAVRGIKWLISTQQTGIDDDLI